MELTVLNITKKYGKFKALKDFSFSFTPGIYGLLGPNGAGKSTLMNIISGVLEASGGEVLWNEKNINALGKTYRNVLGYLPQVSGYYKNFTAREFLEYVAMLKGIKNKKQAKKEIEELLKQVNLTEAADKKLEGFSGGMRQRVGIAQALLGNPQVIIFDEPTAGLDPKERIRFRNLISELAFDKIIILATHIVSDVEMVADNIVLIREGELIQSGTIDECVSVLDGKVFEKDILQKNLKDFTSSHKVISISRSSNEMAKVRFIQDNGDNSSQAAKPSLEDIYLFYFGADE